MAENGATYERKALAQKGGFGAASFDPAPRRGFACSEPCARCAENESKMRAYLAIDLLNRK